jgi:DNA-binding winged helix-turn-helix (wHTH) protein
MRIGADVYIKPNIAIIRGSQYRISNPMFRLLCAFNEYQEEVLSRAFLLSYGWGKHVTVENNVTVAISELRTLLSNKSDLAIITIRGKGYQMVHTKEDYVNVKN